MSTIAQRILAEAGSSARRMRVHAFAFDERVPPAEIQLWNAGDNPTDFGVHKWTARSSVDVLARYEGRGNPLLIDVEHNGAKLEDDEPAITGGYARLELRAGAPWLVFDWSAYAVEQIATGQRRFLSPEYDVDRETGEILALYRVSLVADPGTHRARMLAAATNQETGMDPKLAAIMAILGSVSDPAAAIEAIKSLVENLDGGGAAPPAAAGEAGEMAAAGDAPGGDGGGGGAAPADDKDKDKDKVAAAAKSAPAAAVKPPAPAAAAPPAPPAAPAAAPHAPAIAVETTTVKAAADAAVLQIGNAQRDHLLATQGDRLDPSIRRWASSQPLAVVTGLLNAAPAQLEPPARIAATRGDTQGKGPGAKGLDGRDLEELEKAMGTFKTSAPEPRETATLLVLPSVPPSVHRERKRAAAAAAAAPAAGKAGK